MQQFQVKLTEAEYEDLKMCRSLYDDLVGYTPTKNEIIAFALAQYRAQLEYFDKIKSS